jgi:hypothetical protein
MDLKKRRQFNEKFDERLLTRRSHEACDIRRFKDEREKQFKDAVKNNIAELAPAGAAFSFAPNEELALDSRTGPAPLGFMRVSLSDFLKDD